MNLKQCYFTENECYKQGMKMVPAGIMWHSTGANNPNLKRYIGPDDGLIGKNTYNNHWNQSGLAKCVHAFVGKLASGAIATYQTLPWNFVGWHSGAGSLGKEKNANNNGYIGFEICEDDLNDKKYFESVYKEAIELTTHLCKLYNLNPLADGVIIDHAEGNKRGIASNHGDVTHWLKRYGKTMGDVRKDVANMLKIPSTPEPTPVPEKTGYKIKPSALNLRDKPNISGKAITSISKGMVVYPVEFVGTWGKVTHNGKTGYCNLSTTYADKVTEPPKLQGYKIKVGALNMRNKANTGGTILMAIPKGSVVYPVEFVGTWGKYTWNGKTGWSNLSSTYADKT